MGLEDEEVRDVRGLGELDLRAKQRVIMRGAAVGFALTVCIVAVLYPALPSISGMEASIDRLVFALRCNVFVALVLCAGIGVVAFLRTRSDAIDPLAGRETRAMQVHVKYVGNTLEQGVIFCITTAALSTYLDGETMRVIVVATVVFVIGRLLFWWGYLRDPLLRAPGMTMTIVPLVLMLLHTAYRVSGSALGL